MINLNDHLSILGKKVEDRVTGFCGIVSSVSFDLYGCIQCVVTPPVDKDGKPQGGQWFDIQRLHVVSDVPVMDLPKFTWTPEEVSSGRKGPAEKPMFQHD